jgi:hypothetical protein
MRAAIASMRFMGELPHHWVGIHNRCQCGEWAEHWIKFTDGIATEVRSEPPRDESGNVDRGELGP